mmetsp:Transcript_22416/g.64451  ORF Transcript_22416/g.64451 Transcript_22416/m.64451 type:complete len:237 (-) Transcript_22416:12-722(-)
MSLRTPSMESQRFRKCNHRGSSQNTSNRTVSSNNLSLPIRSHPFAPKTRLSSCRSPATACSKAVRTASTVCMRSASRAFFCTEPLADSPMRSATFSKSLNVSSNSISEQEERGMRFLRHVLEKVSKYLHSASKSDSLKPSNDESSQPPPSSRSQRMRKRPSNHSARRTNLTGNDTTSASLSPSMPRHRNNSSSPRNSPNAPRNSTLEKETINPDILLLPSQPSRHGRHAPPQASHA